MPNLKIFLIILFFMSVLYVGLEVLPKHYHGTVVTQTQPILTSLTSEKSQEDAHDRKELKEREKLGYTFVGYFLLLSALIYAKIILGRVKNNLYK